MQICLLLLTYASLLSSPEQPDSAARSYVLDEVVISATRIEAIRSTVAAPVTVLDSSRVALTPGTLLASALATVPGLALREYGGNSAVRSVSVRGFGAENVLVLVDGQRMNTYQNGGVDFGLVSLSQIERVEIVRGGQSGLYGADAVGGIINIQTHRPAAGFAAGIEATLGGFGFSALRARVEGGSRDGSWSVFGGRERGAGNYGFAFDGGGQPENLVRQGADFRIDRLEGSADMRPSEAVRVYARGQWLDADRGSPGPVTDATTTGRARLYDRLLTAQGGIDWTIDEQFRAQGRAGFRYGDERFVDPGILLGGAPLNSRSITRTLSLEPQLHWTPSARTTIAVDAELNRAWMDGSETRDALRWHGGIALSGQHVLKLPGGFPQEIVVFPSVRYDRISDVGHDLSARIGVNAGLLDEPRLRVRGSFGKNFRAPTFNELYWTTGGNPLLRPERSLSTDVGASAMMDLLGELSLDISAFWINSRDRIVWVPATGTYWSPQNVGEVTSRGVEAELRWMLVAGWIELRANSTWLSARKTSSDYPGDPTSGKVLVYTPRQTATLEATLHAGMVNVGIQNLWTSYRYTTPANDEYLPSHSVTSAIAATRIPVAGTHILLKIELLNLFNTDYSSIALYPMPGRELRATMGVEL